MNNEKLLNKCQHACDIQINEIGEILIFCELTDSFRNVTLAECIGNCEAEERIGRKNVKNSLQ